MDVLVGFCLDPAAKDAPAWKYESVDSASANNGQLQVATERRGTYDLPFHIKNIGNFQLSGFDFAQSPWAALVFFEEIEEAPGNVLFTLLESDQPSAWRSMFRACRRTSALTESTVVFHANHRNVRFSPIADLPDRATDGSFRPFRDLR